MISFGFQNVSGAVLSPRVTDLRRNLDAVVQSKLRQTFPSWRPLHATSSGHFWYPPGGYMAWHTNNRFPGWRIYLPHTDEPGKSFFRYLDPATDEVITSCDHCWDVRMFRVDPQVPLWHCVYSETNRFSFGYVIHRKRWLPPVRRTWNRLWKRRGATAASR